MAINLGSYLYINSKITSGKGEKEKLRKHLKKNEHLYIVNTDINHETKKLPLFSHSLTLSLTSVFFPLLLKCLLEKLYIFRHVNHFNVEFNSKSTFLLLSHVNIESKKENSVCNIYLQ